MSSRARMRRREPRAAGASFGSTRTADPFWFAVDATFVIGEAAGTAGPAAAPHLGPADQPGAPLIVEDCGQAASTR